MDGSTVATHEGDKYVVANVVCKEHRMLSGTHYARFELLGGRGAFIGICDADWQVDGDEIRPHFSSKGWGYSCLSGAMFHRREAPGSQPPLIPRGAHGQPPSE